MFYINMWLAQAKNEIFLLYDLFNFLHVLDYLHMVGFSLTSNLQSMVLKLWVRFMDLPRSVPLKGACRVRFFFFFFRVGTVYPWGRVSRVLILGSKILVNQVVIKGFFFQSQRRYIFDIFSKFLKKIALQENFSYS